MKIFASVIVFLAFSVTAFADTAPSDGHLAFEGGALHAHLKWVTPPQKNAESILAVQWMNGATHTPTEADGTLSVTLWMPSMGHGSSPVTIQPGLDGQGHPLPGAFLISRMFFIMDGPWEVRFTLTHANGTKEMQAWPVNVGSMAIQGAFEGDWQ